MSNPDDEGPQQHPLVEALESDPSFVPPNATRITGYVGRSSTSGTWRLYLSPNLTAMWRVPRQKSSTRSSFPATGAPLSGCAGTPSCIWSLCRAVMSRLISFWFHYQGAVRAPGLYALPRALLACGRLTDITHGCTHGGGGRLRGGATDLCGDTADGCSTWCEDTTWCTEPSEC